MCDPSETVVNVKGWADALGGLHDVRIAQLLIGSSKESIVDVYVEDLNANFNGLEGYHRRPCKIRLREVREIIIDLETGEGVRIGDADVTSEGQLVRLRFDLNLGGGARTAGKGSIDILFKRIEIYDE